MEITCKKNPVAYVYVHSLWTGFYGPRQSRGGVMFQDLVRISTTRNAAGTGRGPGVLLIFLLAILIFKLANKWWLWRAKREILRKVKGEGE